jgi:transposase
MSRSLSVSAGGLDLVEASFARVRSEATGRPGYAPGDLLKLYIYGYLNRVRSSRRLEAECHRNIEVIWLLPKDIDVRWSFSDGLREFWTIYQFCSPAEKSVLLA